MTAREKIHHDLQWHGCYSDGWKGEIVDEAFQHPAKVSRALIRRIYEHAFAEGWLRAGDTAVDCFGGIAGTGLDAMLRGVHWVGVELEPKFHALAQQNIDLWKRRYGAMPGFGTATILQGDSRKLASVIGAAGIVVSSPPFLDQEPSHAQGTNFIPPGGKRFIESTYGTSAGQLGKMKEGEPPALIVSSPPYAAIAAGSGGLNTKPGKDGQQSGRSADSASQQADSHYGEADGQLSTMREGDAPACIISSPPFATGDSAGPESLGRRTDPAAQRMKGVQGWGVGGQISAGSLGAMPEGRFDAVVSSPPYERDTEPHGDLRPNNTERQACAERVRLKESESQEQLAAAAGDTFWAAAKLIVQQCHQILRANGMAIWICKDFIRAGKRIPFSDQWLALCESEGFKLVCRHQAMLVAHHGIQVDAFDGDKELKTERKSFFRRLHEKKPGAIKIDWEDVLCLIKV